MHGSPQMDASAMVPGPALVTSASDAFIHSSMLSTKPLTWTRTPLPHEASRSRARRAPSFFPQTTTIWDDAESAAEAGGGCRPSLDPSARAMSTMPPIPSPPPTTRTVGRSASRPSLRRIDAGFSSSDPYQKPLRMGRPCWTIWDSASPRLRAASWSASEGTKHLSTLPPAGKLKGAGSARIAR
jgi:hypothetical protein